MFNELDFFISEFKRLLEEEKLPIQNSLLSGTGIGDISDYKHLSGRYIGLEKALETIDWVRVETLRQYELRQNEDY